jgi:AraC-like DNA-binding protein
MIPAKTSLAMLGLVGGQPAAIRIATPSVIFTIESATAREGTSTLDRSNLLVATRGSFSLSALGSTSRAAVVSFHEPVIAAAETTYRGLGFDRARFARWTRKPTLVPRTVWLHEILHRYLFERHALGEHDNLATRFLEIEIVKELYFLFRDRDDGAERATIVRRYSPAVERALRHIESHLLAECSVAELARLAGASPSTLLRAFHKEVGASPGAYWRDRKLDEALVALRAGRSVGEVATLVGYEHPTAFGFAFRRRFGRAPSALRPRGKVRTAPRS